MASLCGSSPSSTSTTSTSTPDWVTQQFQGTAGIADNLANRGPDQLPMIPNAAPMTNDQDSAVNGLQTATNQGTYGLPQAGQDYSAGSSGLYNNAGYTPQQVTGSTVAPVPNVTAGNFLDANVAQYMSPYLSQVADTSQQALNHQNQLALQNVDSQAATQGAYGGARQGLAEAETNLDYSQTAASMLANLYNTGYTTAQGQISTDQNRQLSADQGNQSTALSANTTDAQLAEQAALANQAAGLTANQQGITANQGLINGSTVGFNNALNSSGALYGAGTAEQQLNQTNLNNSYQNAQNIYNQPQANLNLRLAGQGTNPLAFGSTTTTPVFSNPVGTAAGVAVGAGALFSGANSLFG